jgi:hypothetical protein
LILHFFVKSCIFLRTDMNIPLSNFTGTTTQCISINLHLEISTFTVNAKSRPQKATGWSGIKTKQNNWLTETIFSWYQSIDTKYL